MPQAEWFYVLAILPVMVWAIIGKTAAMLKGGRSVDEHTVTRYETSMDDDRGRVRAVCSCGWSGGWTHKFDDASEEADKHCYEGRHKDLLRAINRMERELGVGPYKVSQMDSVLRDVAGYAYETERESEWDRTSTAGPVPDQDRPWDPFTEYESRLHRNTVYGRDDPPVRHPVQVLIAEPCRYDAHFRCRTENCGCDCHG